MAKRCNRAVPRRGPRAADAGGCAPARSACLGGRPTIKRKGRPQTKKAVPRRGPRAAYAGCCAPARPTCIGEVRVTIPKTPHRVISMGSCFSGFGTDHWMSKTDLLAGWPLSTLWLCEANKVALRFLRGNISGCPIYTDISGSEFRNDAARADVVSAGFPCQPFSSQGNNKGTPEQRGILVLYVVEYVKRCMPNILILENVKGFIQKHRETCLQLVELLRSIREPTDNSFAYHVFCHLLDTSVHGGLPQHRERVYIVAVRRMGRTLTFNWPAAVPCIPICEILQMDRRKLPSLDAFPFQSIKSKHERDLIRQAITVVKERAANQGRSATSFNPIVDASGIRLNMMMDKCPTITYSHGLARGYFSLSHGTRLSARELLRLQGLPSEGLNWCVSERQLGGLAGNAFTGTVYARVLHAALCCFYQS